MKEFKPYPEYQSVSSGLVSQIPKKWGFYPARRIFRLVNGATPTSGEERYWGGDIPWATPEDLGLLEGNTLLTPRRNITREGYQACGTELVPKGSLLLSIRAPVGYVGIAGKPICTNQGCRSLVPKKQVDSRYFYYQLSVLSELLDSLSGGSTFRELSSTTLASVPLVSPPLEEQQTIARFLDYQTAKIDRLIKKQQRLIELLGEQRQAAVSQAVTKGPRPDVPLKGSDTEWLGLIPQHWDIRPIKYLRKQESGSLRPGPFGTQIKGDDFVELSNYPVFNQATVISNNFEKVAYVNEEKFFELKPFIAKPGDLLLTSRGTIGRAAIVPDGQRPGVIHPSVIKVSFDEEQLDPEFAKLIIEDTDLVTEQLRVFSNATTIDVVYAYNLAVVRLPVPPLHEQKEIVEWIREYNGIFDALLEKTQSFIEKLNEHRAALISAAITGKIDVREWEPPAPRPNTYSASEDEPEASSGSEVK